MDTKESFAALQIQAQSLHDTTTFDTITDHRSLDNSNLAEPPAEERPRFTHQGRFNEYALCSDGWF